MNLVVTILSSAIWLFGIALAVLAGYLLLLTVAAFFAPARTPRSKGGPTHRFAILVPAHNEEKLLPRLLESFAKLDYPKSLYTVHVVADNCSDQTAALATQGGAVAHERTDTVNLGKGYALQWLLQRVQDAGDLFDAAVVVDADSVVSVNFLAVMDEHLKAGETVIQSHDAVLELKHAWAESLRTAAMAAINYLRPQGRMVLGGSAGLKGNGMVFHRTTLEEHEWSASVTEDIEYHMSMILAGKRVKFAPDAVVWAEMPTELSNSQTQNVRWEQGRLEMARAYVPQLLKAALRPRKNNGQQSRYLLLDAAMEHIIPPFSILAGLSVVYFALALAIGDIKAVLLAVGILLAQVLYLFASLMLTGASHKTYLALIYTPAFMVWKIWLYIRILLGFEQQGWVRTARDDA